MKRLKNKRNIVLQGENSCLFNDEHEGYCISQYTLLAYREGKWNVFTEKAEPICTVVAVFNKNEAQVGMKMDGRLVHFEKGILLWREKGQETEELTKVPWNGLIFTRAANLNKVLKWSAAGYCGEELSELTWFMVDLVLDKDALIRQEVMRSLERRPDSTNSDTSVFEI